MITDLSFVFQRIADLDGQADHSEADRKQGGITYTPLTIARDMVLLLAPTWEETIHEPACGRGVFVFALVEYWLEQGRTVQEVADWGGRNLFLVDTDSAAVEDLKRLWTGFFEDNGVAGAALNAHASDGLFGVYRDRNFDIIIGNPPYVRIQHLAEESRVRIRDAFASCKKGNVDLYYAFFEDALRRAKRVCYIMPNSWLSNRSAKTLRQLAKPKTLAVVDFGATLMFAPVRAYTAIVMTGTTTPDDVIRVRGSLPSTKEPWLDIARDDDRWLDNLWTPLIARTALAGDTLGDVVKIVSGIATLSDSSYLLPSPTLRQIDGKTIVEQLDPDFPEHTLRVPIDFAPRLIKATRPGALGSEGPRILCPYDANWAIIDEARLTQDAPDLLAWLQRRKGTLDKRDKGKTAGYEAWYAYGRRQGFWTPEENEVVLLVPQMGNRALASFRVDSKQTNGRFLFTSGYVLRLKNPRQMTMIQAHLSSQNAWTFVQREGKAWAGKGDYRTIGARALRKLPL